MHSRIFQVSLEPIDKSNYITESDYWDHWFTHEIADYVNADCDRDEDVKWLSDCAKGYAVGSDDNGEYFIVTSKTEYFGQAFERFKSTLDRIKDCTIEDFVQGFYEMWMLKDAYENRFSFYVDADGELLNFDKFIRLCVTGEKYYIGGIIDYHC